jgi:hypothetical protein
MGFSGCRSLGPGTSWRPSVLSAALTLARFRTFSDATFIAEPCSVFGLGASVSARILSLCDRNIVFSSPSGSQEKCSTADLFGRTCPVGIPRQPAFHPGLRQPSLHRMLCSATSIKVQGTKKRRRTIRERREIMEETLVQGASVSRVARRHDVNANQVFY